MVADPHSARVAFRFLTAGGFPFSEYGEGSNPETVFRALVRSASAELGTGEDSMYSGTIAEKAAHGFVIRSPGVGSVREAERFATRDLKNNQKFGPAFAVPVLGSGTKTKRWTVTLRADSEEGARNMFPIWAKAQYKTDVKTEITSVRDTGTRDKFSQLWEVKGSVTVPAPPVGFLFYGYASS